MSAPSVKDDAAVGEAASAEGVALLAGRALVSIERFASSGRTSYSGPAALPALRPDLAIGAYRAWEPASARRTLAAEDTAPVRGVGQRRSWTDEIAQAARAAVAGLGRRPVITAWYSTGQLRSWAGPDGLVSAIDADLRQRLEDKAAFGEILRLAGVPEAIRLAGVRIDGPLPSLADLRRAVSSDRVVVQSGADSGGRGTVFVDVDADLAQAAAMPGPYRVTPFVTGWSSNITILSAPRPDGTLRVYVDRPSHKAVGVPEAGIAPAKSAGNTWSIPWPRPAAEAVVDAAVRIAEWAWAEHRMAGLFGVDALLTEDGRVVLNEINCRNQGTTEVSGVNQQLRGLPPFAVAHLVVLLGGRAEWLSDPEAFNEATIDAATSSAPGPYYLKLRHRGPRPVTLTGLHGPGIYRPAGGSLHWVGPGSHPAEAGPGQVLLANLPAPDVLCLPGAELGTAEAISAGADGPFADPHTLSATGRQLLAALDHHLTPATRPEGTAP
ncbi:ATP-grasp domain-containing protein [Kitasatospora sp. MBT66]|uniref:ATP-grasp domain-containing protein n=1 Tax=Kitasatospora sp. MBT66 TaxID=1444769 RepID=UPI0005B7FD38|nr:ATP-grasp domain-containing protein [Kitasatospora sp. MBT66]